MKTWNLIVAIVLAFGLSGCGSDVKVVPAGGLITLKGAPLAGANISAIYPDGNIATGVSNDQGKFFLSYNGKMGAAPGADLRVTVSKVSGPTASVQIEQPKTMDPAAWEKYKTDSEKMMIEQAKAMEGKKDIKPKDLVDPKYSAAESSGLKLTIPEGGSEDLKLELP